jgi:hypothetical protein
MLTISGVPVLNGMNDIEVIVKISGILQLGLDGNDIIRCWRAKVNDPSRVPLLYCRFVDIRSRNIFFHSCMRSKNVKLDNIKSGMPGTKIYVNEMLTNAAFKVYYLKAKGMVKVKKLNKVYTVD